MLLLHPRSLRWRQTLPPAFVLTSLLGVLAAPWWPPARWLLAIEWSAYVLVLLAAAIVATFRSGVPMMLVGLPVSWVVMHLAWGASFWRGLVAGAPRSKHARSA
jgi:hypothetical protein